MDERESLVSLGERIRNERKRRGLSQTELAARIGYSMNGLARIERGESDPKFTALRRIATVLGMSMTSLFAEPGESQAAGLDDLRQQMDQLTNTYKQVLQRLEAARA